MADDSMAVGSVVAPSGRAMSLLVPMQRTLGMSTLVVGSRDRATDKGSPSGRPRSSNAVAGPRHMGQLVRSAVAPESRESADIGKKEEMKRLNSLQDSVEKKMEETPVNKGTKGMRTDMVEKKNEDAIKDDKKVDGKKYETSEVKEVVKVEDEQPNLLSPVKIRRSEEELNWEQDEMGEGFMALNFDKQLPWDFEDLTLDDQAGLEQKEPEFKLGNPDVTFANPGE